MKKRNVKSPITSGVANVPVVMQMEALECGAACLAMVLAYYGVWVPLEKVRLDCGVSRDGSSAGNMMVAAEHYGLKASGYSVEPEDVIKEGEFPCIIHWNFNHFVVLKGFRGGKAYLNDPARGNVTVSMEEFDKSFTGVCLLFEPTEKLVPKGHKKSMLAFVWRRINGLKKLIVLSAVVSLAVTLLSLINASTSRIFIDYLLGGKNPDWVLPFFIVMLVLLTMRFVIALVQSILSLKVGGKITISGELSYMWKVMKLPMNFFSQRLSGDIMGRATSNATVGNTLVNRLAPLFFNTVMMVFYFIVMLRYNYLMTIVGVLAILIDTAVSILISAKRVNVTRAQLRDSGILSSTTLSGIQMIETIKSTGAERGFFEKWSGSQAAANMGTYRFDKLNRGISMIPTIVNSLSNLLVQGMGIFLVINGEFTLGMITMFQGFLSSFMGPARSLLDMGQTIQEMRTTMERIDDVMEYPEDPNYEIRNTDSSYEKLSGNIEIDDVTFGYAPLGKPVIEHFSLNIKKGQSIALVGTSGCGKSTMSKLISGLYHPWSGSIKFDGRTVSEIDRDVFTGSVAVVDQDIILFEDTIANNIKMRDHTILDFEMILAARDAQIHDDIMARPEGYQTMLNERGTNLSGGQRQRLEIARVLAQDPTIIVLDEATSALDARTEYNLIRSVKERGLTCIVVAHRLSTIKDCDEIVVLEKGRIAERGTHEELLKNGKLYASLVTNE